VAGSDERVGIAAAALGAVLCAITVWVTVEGAPGGHPWLEALARASTVGVPIAVGIYARGRPPFRRFGTLLIAAGFAWFLSTLAASSESLPYSVGRVASWAVEVGLLYVVLAFPTGRLPARVDRLIVGSAVLTLLLLYLPTMFLVEQYPSPSPYAMCDSDCPANAFMLAGSEPAFVADVVRPLRELLTVCFFAAAAVRLGYRMSSAGHLTRRTLAPVFTVASARVGVMAATVAVRAVDPGAALVPVLSWLLTLAVPAMAIAFLVGLGRWRLFVGGAVQRLAGRLPPHPGPDDLRVALADAFEDPGLEIAYWIGDGDGHWADAAEIPYLPPPGAPRSVTEVHDGGRKVAAIVHDPALAEERAFVGAATSYAVITFDNHRLSAQAAALLRQVADSRARIQATADDERRRIERDLHDGAQQRLVALRIKLMLTADQLDDGSRDGDPALLRTLGDEVDTALDEIRSLAHGIYPATLDRGLVEALRSAALQGPLPIVVHAAGIGRYPRELETAVYFTCLEALQNAAKHASGATAAVVDVAEEAGELRFEVRDDGAGYDPATAGEGMGLTSMRDRLAAVGGRLTIVSSPGHGTRVRAVIPVEPR